MRLYLLLIFLTLHACSLTPKREEAPAQVKDSSIDSKINPVDEEDYVIQTVPLMNGAVRNLYSLAQSDYQNSQFTKALAHLQRAYRIQTNSAEVTQLMAEIFLHQGDAKQAHYWASIATKNSPAKGNVCEKSWRILAIAAELMGYDANQAMALENKEECLVKAPARY